MFKKYTSILTYIISFSLASFNAASEELNMREILEIIQKDLRTLERAVYSESFEKKPGRQTALSDKETEDVLTRHLLKLSEIENQFQELTNKFEENGVVYAEPTVDFFSFNNPIGACPTCEGYGKVMGIDENLVIPNRNLTIYENAIACWRGEKMSQWKNDLIANVSDDQLPIHQPINKLSEAQYQLLWNGNENFHGIHSFFNYLESKSYKIQYRVMLSRYRGKTTCPSCNGTRLRKDAQHVKIGGHSITDICSQSIAEAKSFFDALSLNAHDGISFRTNDTERARITQTGDFGITGSLNVTGNISGSATHTGSFGSVETAGNINSSGRIFEQNTSVIDHATAMAIVFGG